MRVMVIVRADTVSESGEMPSGKMLADMGRFNEELAKAGVLVSADGLRPSSAGALLRFSNGASSVARGPLVDASVAGFWLWRVDSLDEAIEWASKAPFENAAVELRPVMEAQDCGKADAPELQHQPLDTREQLERFTGIETS